jgi:endo-1,4-beta-xylanase
MRARRVVRLGGLGLAWVLVAMLRLVGAELAAAREIPLWTADAPGSEGRSGTEVMRVTAAGEHVVSAVHRPSVTPWLPVHGDGSAVLVIPGGGHRELWMDHEGHHAARWLAARGTAAFVLKYRLARETNSPYRIQEHALADARRAVRMMRARAKEWGIDPGRVGALGFSAGGELAWLASAGVDPGHPGAIDPVDRLSSRPDFIGLVYPGRTGDIQPTTHSAPAFLACAQDDRKDIGEGLAEAYLRYRRAGVPAELHVFATGGHGFGVRATNARPSGRWLERFEDWMIDAGHARASGKSGVQRP